MVSVLYFVSKFEEKEFSIMKLKMDNSYKAQKINGKEKSNNNAWRNRKC